MRSAILSIVAATLVSGCSLRSYHAPETAPAALAAAQAESFSDAGYDAAWWREFDDPVLQQLEDRTLAANLDVRAAVARFDQARAIFDDTSLDRFPTATLDASFDRRKQVIPGFSETPVRTSTYRTALDVSWEIDVFGRVRNQVRAAAANAESFDAALDDVRVLVAAEVARNYFELRGLQQRMSVTERSLVNAQESLRLTQVRRDAGIGEEQDVASAAARVSAVQALVPPLRTAQNVRENRLAVLAGERPGGLDVDLAPRPYPALAKQLPIGDPAGLLRRRPDVRVAERRLAAAAGREGVAAADLFPRISFSGVLGFLAGRGSMFGKSESQTWAVTPALSWAAFDIGSAHARLRGAEAASREQLAEYQHTVLRALEEAQNALVAYREQQLRLVSLTDQARESGRAAAIARIRYREGIADFLSLLDAERTELQAQDEVAQAETEVFTGVVQIYKSLGGIPRDPTATPATTP